MTVTVNNAVSWRTRVMLLGNFNGRLLRHVTQRPSELSVRIQGSKSDVQVRHIANFPRISASFSQNRGQRRFMVEVDPSVDRS